MPQDLKIAVEKSGKRASRKKMMEIIINLCTWQELSSAELAKILVCNQSYIVNQYLNPLIHSQGLKYTIPDNPSDPNQAYRSTKPIE